MRHDDGGAPFLGLDRVFIKAHGRSNTRAIANAIRVAAKAAAANLPREIEQSLAEFAALRAETETETEPKAT